MKARGQTKAKKEARYKSYLSSAAWKAKRREALERAGHQCEHEWLVTDRWGDEWGERCAVTAGLHVHHKTYARFGGDELPEDLEVLCKAHHEMAEAKHPTRRRPC